MSDCPDRKGEFGPTAYPPAAAAAPVRKSRRRLPHWHQENAIYWITFRLADSVPQDKLRLWRRLRDDWLSSHPPPWSDEEWQDYDERFGKALDAWLDRGYGCRALARPEVRAPVQACLLRFDGDRLLVHAAVIIPTHVHILLEPSVGWDLSRILHGMKGTSARQANVVAGTRGVFWQDESFDHIVRSEKQYLRFLDYVAANPSKARLRKEEFWLYGPEE